MEVNNTNKRNNFYWLTESQGENPDQDPLLFWYQGGPGCSGLGGLFTEHGPFRATADGDVCFFFFFFFEFLYCCYSCCYGFVLFKTKIIVSFRSSLSFQNKKKKQKNKIQVVLAEFSWNEYANVVYLEQPTGVGFSYSGEDNFDGDFIYACNDQEAAEENFNFIEVHFYFYFYFYFYFIFIFIFVFIFIFILFYSFIFIFFYFFLSFFPSFLHLLIFFLSFLGLPQRQPQIQGKAHLDCW